MTAGDIAAARVGAYLWENRGHVVTIGDIARGTHLSESRIHGAERALKQFVADNADKFQGYTLYIALGPSGEHGFIQESAKTISDQVSRARYMLNRQQSEMNYTAQAAVRILDEHASTRLSRALRAYQGAAAMLEDVLEVVESTLAAS